METILAPIIPPAVDVQRHRARLPPRAGGIDEVRQADLSPEAGQKQRTGRANGLGTVEFRYGEKPDAARSIASGHQQYGLRRYLFEQHGR